MITLNALELSERFVSAGFATRLGRKVWPLFAEASVPRAHPWSPERPQSSCLVWLGAKYTFGHGCVYSGGRRMRPVHAVSYELVVGEIPANKVLGHRCENHPCGNPGHVRPVTQGENAREGLLRVFPDELLDRAPRLTCSTCVGSMTASVHVTKTRPERPHWQYYCPPCGSAYARRHPGEKPPTGRRSASMSTADIEFMDALMGLAS